MTRKHFSDSRSPARWLTVSTAAVCVSVVLQPACSSDSKHPSLISTGGGSDSNAGSSAGGAAGTAPGTDDAAGGSGDGNSTPGSAGSAGAAVTVPAMCSKTATWSGAVTLKGISGPSVETLLSTTPDELDLAFTRDGALYVAHRAQVSDDFEVGAPIVVEAGWAVSNGASLSADGKRLVLAGDGESKLGELTRSSRTTPFEGSVDATAFQQVNHDAVYTGRIYAAPVVSAGDDQLFFNSAYPTGGSTVVVATRKGDGPWSTPTRLASDALDGEIGKRRLPNSVSADTRTLFYFNEESMQEEARWRESAVLSSPLYDMLSLGTRRGATPNSACDRLYSEADSDVVVEKD
jgi:hypothetical protein